MVVTACVTGRGVGVTEGICLWYDCVKVDVGVFRVVNTLTLLTLWINEDEEKKQIKMICCARKKNYNNLINLCKQCTEMCHNM